MADGAERAVDHRRQHAKRLEHLQPVVPDIDPLAEAAQRTALLVDADLPASLREGESGGQPGDAAAGDLDRALHVANASGMSSQQTV